VGAVSLPTGVVVATWYSMQYCALIVQLGGPSWPAAHWLLWLWPPCTGERRVWRSRVRPSRLRAPEVEFQIVLAVLQTLAV
jgi:hypothetical protein